MLKKNGDPTFLCALILKCEEPRRVAAWYQQTLGLPLAESGSEFSCLLGQTHFAIHGLQEGQSPTVNVELGIYIPNLNEFLKELEAKKSGPVEPIQDYPWARSAQMKDPLGNLIYLMELPKSSMDALGRELAKAFRF